MVNKTTSLLLGAMGLGLGGLWLLRTPVRENGARGVAVEVDGLRRHVAHLASDELEGRGTGTEGGRKSAQYVAEQLKSYGLKPLFRDSDGSPSFFQPFVLRSRQMNETPAFLLRFGDRVENLEAGEDVGLRWTDASYRRELSLVYVGYGIQEPEVGWDDFAGIDGEDRCAVVEIGAPPEIEHWPDSIRARYRTPDSANTIKANNIIAAGATCVLAISPRDSSMPWARIVQDVQTRFVDVRGMRGPLVPDMLLLSLSREWTKSLFEQEPFDPSTNRGRYHSFELSSSIDVTLSLQEKELYARNVGGVVAGTDPSSDQELVTLSAHFDGLGNVGGAIYNGANDNAASVAAMLEAARLQALRPSRRPAAFLFFSAEELGLLGSNYFLEMSPVPLESLVVNVNYEMVGGNIGRGFNVNGTTSLSSDLRPILDAANKNGPRAHLDFSRDQRNGGGWVSLRSDHYNFFRRGIPVLYFVGGGTSYYHTPEDDTATVDFDRTLEAAWLAVALAQELGNRDRRPGLDM